MSSESDDKSMDDKPLAWIAMQANQTSSSLQFPMSGKEKDPLHCQGEADTVPEHPTASIRRSVRKSETMLSSQQKKHSDLLPVTQLSISNVSTTRQRRFSADAEGKMIQLPESTRVEPPDGDKAVKAEGGIEECFEDQATAIQPQQEGKDHVAAMMPDCDTTHLQIVCEEGIRVAQCCGVQDLRTELNAKCYSFVPDGVGTSALNALPTIRALSRLQQLFGMWPHRSLLPSLHDWTGLNHQLKVQDRSSVKDCLVPEPMLTADVHAQHETVKPLNQHSGEYLLEPQPGIPLSVKDLSGPIEFTKQRQHLDVPSVDVPSVGLENSLKLVSGTGDGVKKDDPLNCRDDVLGKSQSFLGIYKRGFVFNYSQSTMQQANLRGMIGAKRHDSISNVGTDTLIFIHNFDSGLVHGAYQRTSDILALRSGQWKVGSGSFEWACMYETVGPTMSPVDVELVAPITGVQKYRGGNTERGRTNCERKMLQQDLNEAQCQKLWSLMWKEVRSEHEQTYRISTDDKNLARDERKDSQAKQRLQDTVGKQDCWEQEHSSGDPKSASGRDAARSNRIDDLHSSKHWDRNQTGYSNSDRRGNNDSRYRDRSREQCLYLNDGGNTNIKDIHGMDRHVETAGRHKRKNESGEPMSRYRLKQ